MNEAQQFEKEHNPMNAQTRYLSVIQPGQSERHDTHEAAWERIKDSAVRAIVIRVDDKAAKIVAEVS